MTVKSEVRVAATVEHQPDDTGVWRRRHTGLAKMAILSLELSCFSQLSFIDSNHALASSHYIITLTLTLNCNPITPR